MGGARRGRLSVVLDIDAIAAELEVANLGVSHVRHEGHCFVFFDGVSQGGRGEFGWAAVCERLARAYRPVVRMEEHLKTA